MNTFPADLRINFAKGVNVIFGGNHSGKTTIVNSLKYGVFGLSWDRSSESFEARYFAQRIKETDKKSLDIATVYNIKNKIVTITRTVFSSGTTELKALTSAETDGSLSSNANVITRERDYYDMIRQQMGLSEGDYFKFVPSLIFSEENRQAILWSKNIESFALGLLGSGENMDRLSIIDAQLGKAERDLEKLRNHRQLLKARWDEKKANEHYVKSNLALLDETGLKKFVDELASLNYEIDMCRKTYLKLDIDLEKQIGERGRLQLQINKSQKSLLTLDSEREKLNEEIAKAFLSPKDPKETHFGRYFYFEKKCPFCSSDLSTEIDGRISNGKCAICGKGEVVNYNIDPVEIQNKRLELDSKSGKLTADIEQMESQVSKISSEIDRLSLACKEEKRRETSLAQKINEFKATEVAVYKKDILSKQLVELQILIENNEKAIAADELEIAKVESEISEIKVLQLETRALIRTEISSALMDVKNRFSAFIKLASNGELSAELSSEFIPSLRGRSIYHDDQVSQFERMLMDLAFRVVLLSVFAEKSDTTPSIVLDTPDEVTDESYIPHLAEAITRYCGGLCVVVTTVKLSMMESLLKTYGSEERKKRFTDLVSKGNMTQLAYYQRHLLEFLRFSHE